MMARIFLVLTQRFGIPDYPRTHFVLPQFLRLSHEALPACYSSALRSLYPTLRTAVTPRMCHSRFVLALVLCLLLRESLP